MKGRYGQKTFRIPAELGPFFLYLRVVRGLSVGYAAKLTRALFHSPRSVNARTARRYFSDFQTEWWVYDVEGAVV